MARKHCRAELDLYDETYRCVRRRGHDGKHRAPYREHMTGADVAGQFVATLDGGVVRWRRVPDRRA